MGLWGGGSREAPGEAGRGSRGGWEGFPGGSCALGVPKGPIPGPWVPREPKTAHSYSPQGSKRGLGPNGPKGPVWGPPRGSRGGSSLGVILFQKPTFKADVPMDDSLKSPSGRVPKASPASILTILAPYMGGTGGGAWVPGSPSPPPPPYSVRSSHPPKRALFLVNWSPNWRTLGSWLIVGKVG